MRTRCPAWDGTSWMSHWGEESCESSRMSESVLTPMYLMEGLGEHPYVYFVHSYYVPVCAETIATADYILPYSASMHKDNFYTCQFHPEKSGKIGERILRNFLEL